MPGCSDPRTIRLPRTVLPHRHSPPASSCPSETTRKRAWGQQPDGRCPYSASSPRPSMLLPMGACILLLAKIPLRYVGGQPRRGKAHPCHLVLFHGPACSRKPLDAPQPEGMFRTQTRPDSPSQPQSFSRRRIFPRPRNRTAVCTRHMQRGPTGLAHPPASPPLASAARAPSQNRRRLRNHHVPVGYGAPRLRAVTGEAPLKPPAADATLPMWTHRRCHRHKAPG